MQFEIALRYLPELLIGLGATSLLSLEVVVLGTFVGLLFTPPRISHRPVVRWFFWAVVNPFRILPVLVLLVWGFYALPLGLGVTISEWNVAVLALGLNMGAFCAEIFRKAVEEVDPDHVESAMLLGYSRIQAFRTIILPLAFRNASIPYLTQILQSTKLTVLAAMISVREVYHVTADIIQQTNRPLELYTMLALLMFVPLLALTLLVEFIEARHRGVGGARRWNWIDRSPA